MPLIEEGAWCFELNSCLFQGTKCDMRGMEKDYFDVAWPCELIFCPLARRKYEMGVVVKEIF